ncbi:hypothetical protein QGN29_00090 [Temperatibacter marinus]|uniref:Rod shape-determining protein MreD n=1 Tax=Temperatibacter marinus TaxID=1456591 RepID=A0AA52H9Q3_9PROT|nr:hypothetical protein [Temperatibacter marinus]WND02767.1 hypothetical protein QGN29_00090 [Temperatibacter marinus]
MAKVKLNISSFGAKGYVPLMVSLFLSALMLLPVGTGVSNLMMPHFALMCVFYWTSTRPLMMPYGACAIIGLMLDLWLNVPMGLNLLILVLARLFVINQIKYYKGRSRLIYWAVFAVLAAGLFTLSWALTSIVSGRVTAVEPILFQFLLTIFSYAIIGLLLGRIRRTILA